MGTGLVMVSVSLSNVVLLARDDALTWLVRGAAFVDNFVVGTGSSPGMMHELGCSEEKLYFLLWEILL